MITWVAWVTHDGVGGAITWVAWVHKILVWIEILAWVEVLALVGCFHKLLAWVEKLTWVKNNSLCSVPFHHIASFSFFFHSFHPSLFAASFHNQIGVGLISCTNLNSS